MSDVQQAANPFALMMDPESVFRAIERSERLSRIKGRICRPLDKVPATGDEATSDDAESDAGHGATSLQDHRLP